MKKCCVFLVWLLLAGLLPVAGIASYGGKEEETENGFYGQVASDEEQLTPQDVGVEGMVPIFGKDVTDGVYEVKAESSSPMFRIEKASLTVCQGNMTAVLTLSGKGYRMLYMGTAIQASVGETSDYIYYKENENGKYTYEIPVEALDMPVACAAFSENREKWYDRNLLFRADSLPEGTVLVEITDYEEEKRKAREERIAAMREAREQEQELERKTELEAKGGQESRTELETKNEQGSKTELETKDEQGSKTELETKDEQELKAEPVKIDLPDGEYSIEIELKGGSGRAALESPAVLVVKNGKAYGRIQWDSPYYDYMKVNEQKFLPVNSDGNSMFEIPVLGLNQEFAVIGDTTAMGMPHEIEYTLTFYWDSQKDIPKTIIYGIVMVILAFGAAGFWMVQNRQQRKILDWKKSGHADNGKENEK